MKTIIMSLTLLSLAAAGTANAAAQPAPDRPSKEQSIGMASGVAIGAVAGGPVGAFAGLVIGSLLGERMNTQKKTVVALNRQLADSSQAAEQLKQQLAESGEVAEQLKQQLAESNRSVAQLSADLKLSQERLTVVQSGQPSLPSAVQRNLRAEMLFRTNDSSLAADTSARLAELAQLISTTPGAVARLDAYADPRGGENENLVLSAQRAEAVRAALLNGGLAPERIAVTAHGEHDAVSVQGDIDGYALERRVVITIGESLPVQAAN